MLSIDKLADKKKPAYENGIWTGPTEPLHKECHRFRSIVLERLRKFPDRVGQIDGITGKEDTYGHIADRVVRCALWLKSQNIKATDVIGICAANHFDTTVPLVASILVGAIVNPWWHTTLNHDLAKHFLELSKPKIIFADEETMKMIKKVVDDNGVNVKIIVFKNVPGFETFNQILEKQDSSEVAKFQCKDLDDMREPALILYTSGTTGYPKGALHCYAWLARIIAPILEKPVVNFWTAGIAWVSGCTNTFSNIITCSTAVLYERPTEEIILQLIEKYKVNRLLTINTACATRLWKLKILQKYDLSALETMVIGASVMFPEVDEFIMKNFPNVVIAHGYGSTETSAICARIGWTGKPTSCGMVLPNYQLKIIDITTGKTLGPNHKGEMCLKYPYSTLGYYNNEESTKTLYDEEGWLHTGDIGFYDTDGEFFIDGRQSELIKYKNNLYVSSNTIENVIIQHPAVLEAAVVAKPHPVDVEQPMAFVSPLPNAMVIESEIIEIVEKNLPDYMRLRGGVVILDALPHTISGKIAKNELKLMMKNL